MADRPLLIDVRHPLIVKANDLFLLTEEDGSVPRMVPGMGLFYRDCCYLGRYGLSLGGKPLVLLASSDEEGFAARVSLANRDGIRVNGRALPVHTIAVERRLLLREGEFVDTIAIRNFGTEAVVAPFALAFGAEFQSMFVLRGTPPGARGELRAPEWDGSVLRFAYAGADGVLRTLTVSFSEAPMVGPCTSEESVASFEIALAPQERRELVVCCRIDGDAGAPSKEELDTYERATAAGWLEGMARVETSSGLLGRTVQRSLADIRLLRVRRGEHQFTAAGAPWFIGLFGRDSLLPTLQCLAYDPDLGDATTRALAAWQGTKYDETTGEEPGKILHELRVGEMAHLHEVPQTPSYASVDSTLLFLIAVARHVQWAGRLDLFEALRPHVERAIGWMEERTRRGEGYIWYFGTTKEGGPVNQSWRDSATGVLRADGSFPAAPIAIVEVQGYAYQARVLMAEVFRRVGEAATAERLERDAAALRERFHRDFWMEEEGCFCLGLEKGGVQITSVSSNAAQVLWTGIAEPERARRTVERVMREDMFSGWGVRTLSERHVRFDPLAYQQGSVWAFDNSLILSGFRRYGEDGAACRVFEATLAAAGAFRSARLPEFIAGMQRREGGAPVHTPRADPLQAWSAGAAPFMLSEMLGLEADGFARQLHVRRPVLPEGIEGVVLRDVRVGEARVSLRFRRGQDGAVRGEVIP